MDCIKRELKKAEYLLGSLRAREGLGKEGNDWRVRGCRKAGSAMVFSRVCIDMHEFDRGCPDANYLRGHGYQSSTALSNFFAARHSDKRRDKRKGVEVKVSHGGHVLLHVP